MQPYINDGQACKRDAGKLKLSLVPPQIIADIAKVREFGCEKYGDPESWRGVDRARYIDAAIVSKCKSGRIICNDKCGKLE